ncbi:multiple sugar transport system substrate-binding protein [Palleronia marisminoris]|uniref:Putative ABC transporter substrate-binding protein YesO n=2 Tax=Palleronia marisminoris TaxID=315423 RepID=A0A1Y5SZB7_9RHOB|nr:multiple sugar transport system substrate-binding protein [Palleronia marisminoris]SLN52418.1 Putative ABC transporter substrate-binding protein YesO [Palleronia marisminoris]
MKRFGMGRIAALAGVAAAALLAGPVAAQDAKELRMLWWGSQPRADRTFEVIDMYQEANPDVSIQGETVGWSDYWTRLATQVAGRNAPDVIQQDYRYLFEYGSRGALADMMPYRDEILALPGVSEEDLQSGMADGKLWGVNLGVNSVAMMVNATAFEEAGVRLPENGDTWAEVKELAIEVAEKSDQIDYGIEDSSGYEPAFQNWLRQRGKDLYTAEGQLAFDESDVVAWYEFWADMRDSGAAPPPDVQALDQRSIETNQVSLGNTAIGFANSNQLVGFSQINEDEIVMRVFPLVEGSTNEGHYFKPSQLLSVAASTEFPEDSMAFVNFFITDTEAGKVLDVERGVPISDQVREAIRPELDEDGLAQLEFIEGLDPYAGTLPPPPPQGAGEIDQMMISVGQQVAFGQLTPEEGAERLVSSAESILSR